MKMMKRKRQEEHLPRTKSMRKRHHLYHYSIFSLSFMGGLGINFFKSEWSYAQFKVQEGQSLCAFSEDA